MNGVANKALCGACLLLVGYVLVTTCTPNSASVNFRTVVSSRGFMPPHPKFPQRTDLPVDGAARSARLDSALRDAHGAIALPATGRNTWPGRFTGAPTDLPGMPPAPYQLDPIAARFTPGHPGARNPLQPTAPGTVAISLLMLTPLAIAIALTSGWARHKARHLRFACFNVLRGAPGSVVVVGARGPLGRAVVQALLDRSSATTIKALGGPPDEDPLPSSPRLTYTDCNFASEAELAAACEGADTVVWCPMDQEPDPVSVAALCKALGGRESALPRVVAYAAANPLELPSNPETPCAILRPKAAAEAAGPDAARALVDVVWQRPLPPDSAFEVRATAAPTAASPLATPAPAGPFGWSTRTVQLAVLFSVPLVWGTYAPAVRFIYTLPVKVPGIFFSSLYYLVATLFLSAVAAALRPGPGSAPEDAAERQAAKRRTLLGGAELGGYLFLGSYAQVLGLQATTSGQAAFITQLTTISVPVLEALLNRTPVPRGLWAASFVALAGVLVVAADGMAAVAAADPAATLPGFLLLGLATLFYTLHIVRLGVWAPKCDAIPLALSKAAWELLFSVALMGGLAVSGTDSGREIVTFLQQLMDGVLSLVDLQNLGLAAVWTGAVTFGYTLWAQSFGQAGIRPVEANLIYSTQPIWSTFFGAVLLGETLGPAGVVGFVLIGAAMLLAIQAEAGAGPGEAEEPEEVSDDDLAAGV